MTDLIDNLPSLDETLLANLFANAQRLARDGNEQQRASAADMLVAVEYERAKQPRLRRGSRSA